MKKFPVFLLLLTMTLPAPAQTAMRLPAIVTLAPMNDPWPAAADRWMDIDRNVFNDWVTNGTANGKFSYANATVRLTYDRAPTVPYLVGHIEASGLKPNFAYQLKLLGKPQRGTRGWGPLGDDVANERIGYAGRWWDDTQNPIQTNFDDQHFLDFYKNAAPGTEHDIYGYLFIGDVVTDSRGRASTDITGQNSFHITWASWQFGIDDVTMGTFTLTGRPQGSGFYGYGPTAPGGTVTLSYETQYDRTNPVVLPGGKYPCRFVLTEESFHNDKTTTPLGGYWKGVLASEDYDAALQPDQNPANDVTFTVGAQSPKVGVMAPQAAADLPGVARDFAIPSSDADGDLQYLYLRVGPKESPLLGLYNVASNKLYLRDETDTNWLGGFAPGANQTIITPFGTLHCATSRVDKIANGVIVHWSLSAPPEWAGTTQSLYAYARDRLGLTTSWKTLGTWTIGGNHAPVNASLSPGNANSSPQLFVSTHTDADGAGNLRYAMLHAGDSISAAGALRCLYNANTNRLFLLDDAGTTYLGGFAPGTAHVIANTQGSLDCENTNVFFAGNALTVNWKLTAAPSFKNATHTIWLYTRDLAGANTGWQSMGTWLVQ